jgi:23S rRNA pseudouridine2605 synthase
MASSTKRDPSSRNQQKKTKNTRSLSGDKKLNKPFAPRPPKRAPAGAGEGLIRLNRYLSNAGVASRREADNLIEMGLVKVNGKVVTELGTKVDPRKDVVVFDDVSLKPERMRYVLLNKPKDYITTMEDEKGRRTVMSLIHGACKERIYPVGRLDRNTTGLLLFTNDGDLAKRLTHPRYAFPKLYHVETTDKIKAEDLDKLRKGISLEDGFVKADEIEYVGEGSNKKEVGVRIHSGRNRIVRRMFEHLGYTIKKLDRVMFAGLTKKDLPKGRCRHLTEQEVNFLKMIR